MASSRAKDNKNQPKIILGTQYLTEANVSIIHHAIANGVKAFDTADCYGMGASEIALGKALAQYKREDFYISSKCGVRFFEDKSVYVDGSREYLLSGCQSSLKRLNLKCLDIFYLHRVSPNTPIEDSMKAMKELINQGKIRSIGLSEVNVDQIRRAHAIHPIAAVQNEFSPWSRQDEDNGVFAVCRELGIMITGYSPLGRAFFSAVNQQYFESLKDNDYRKFLPRYTGDALTLNLGRRTTLAEYAISKNITLAQLALSWEISKGIIPVFGTNSVVHFNENMEALNIKFSAMEFAEIESLFKELIVEGERYPSPEVSGIFPECKPGLSWRAKALIGAAVVSTIGMFAMQVMNYGNPDCPENKPRYP